MRLPGVRAPNGGVMRARERVRAASLREALDPQRLTAFRRPASTVDILRFAHWPGAVPTAESQVAVLRCTPSTIDTLSPYLRVVGSSIGAGAVAPPARIASGSLRSETFLRSAVSMYSLTSTTRGTPSTCAYR